MQSVSEVSSSKFGAHTARIYEKSRCHSIASQLKHCEKCGKEFIEEYGVTKKDSIIESSARSPIAEYFKDSKIYALAQKYAKKSNEANSSEDPQSPVYNEILQKPQSLASTARTGSTPRVSSLKRSVNFK